MSAIANIAIVDGAATPATHTFTPRATNPANYRNGASAESAKGIAFDESIIIDVSVQPKGVSKVRISLSTPHWDASNLVQYYETAKIEFLLPANSTVQNRKDIRTLLKNLLADAQVVDAVDNLAYPY